jgi:hypothetical protein
MVLVGVPDMTGAGPVSAAHGIDGRATGQGFRGLTPPRGCGTERSVVRGIGERLLKVVVESLGETRWIEDAC